MKNNPFYWDNHKLILFEPPTDRAIFEYHSLHFMKNNPFYWDSQILILGCVWIDNFEEKGRGHVFKLWTIWHVFLKE